MGGRGVGGRGRRGVGKRGGGGWEGGGEGGGREGEERGGREGEEGVGQVEKEVEYDREGGRMGKREGVMFPCMLSSPSSLSQNW